MNRFGMWFANFMRGRYGTDQFNRFLLILALVLIVINMFIRWFLLRFIIIGLLIYVYCRMFSRNTNARYAENMKFLQWSGRLKSKFSRGNKTYSAGGGYSGGYDCNYGGATQSRNTKTKDKTHKILRCPGCGEKLRVPKGIGKINISCPYCNTKFIKKV